MRVRPVSDAGQWETFVLAHAPTSGAFFYERENRVEFLDGERLVGVAVVEKQHTPMGSYLFVPRGPLLADGVSYQEALLALWEFFPEALFIRFEPTKDGDYSWATRTVDVNPKETLVLDLTKSEDDLLAAMHPKTRYNIRLAQRKGAVVRALVSSEFDVAWKVFEETARRDHFRLHAKAHYQHFLETLSAKLIGVFSEGQLLAAHLMVDAYGTRTYLHGASSSLHREVMAPYLLHWQEIKEAKDAGLTCYDFWGVSNTKPAWAGITRFKRGFSGKEISYPGTFDYYRSPWSYKAYTFLRALRRFL
ncbi:peptidoglycan bridge formation glycyltransferase FemA/FemB family protein [Candidatus Uhrbacteria bacterium]|nr:peptidoglycan bridge formation glycyltransferase FemA/FemB family protein [Candidatus Uhrbacteria bacterium]